MKSRLAIPLTALLLLPSVAPAGSPTEDEVVCPVGGESFTVTGTLSCSTMGRTMSFRTVTSCDWVTKLPVCPSNGLPIYKEFSTDQIADLETFLLTPEFESLRELPPWQRAYGVANHLGELGTEVSFGIMLSAMWFETEAFFESELAINKFLDEASQEVSRAPVEEAPFIEAISAYALSVAGRHGEAEEKLQVAESAAGAPTFLLDYIAAIRSCQSDMQRDGCKPNDSFNPE